MAKLQWVQLSVSVQLGEPMSHEGTSMNCHLGKEGGLWSRVCSGNCTEQDDEG